MVCAMRTYISNIFPMLVWLHQGCMHGQWISLVKCGPGRQGDVEAGHGNGAAGSAGRATEKNINLR